MKPYKTIMIRCPVELYRKIKEQAEEENRTVSGLIKAIVAVHIKHNDPVPQLQKGERLLPIIDHKAIAERGQISQRTWCRDCKVFHTEEEDEICREHYARIDPIGMRQQGSAAPKTSDDEPEDNRGLLERMV